MSFASSLDKETPQSLWKEQEALGARLILTIPFGVKPENMLGFVSVMGAIDDFPVLTLCVDKPAGGAIVSTIVFDSSDRYADFLSLLLVDSALHFEEAPQN